MFEIPNFMAAQRKIRPKSTRFPRLTRGADLSKIPSRRNVSCSSSSTNASFFIIQLACELANCPHLSVTMKFSYAASAILGALAAASGADAASFNRIATVSRPSRGLAACAIWLICATYLHCTLAWSGFRLLRSTYWL